MPDVPVADLIVEGNELVIATHGRGFWALDNVAPLRQATPAVLANNVYLFGSPVGVRSGPGIPITWISKTETIHARLEILDSAGILLRTFQPDTAKADSADTPETQRRRGAGPYLPKGTGLQHVTWDLRTQGITTFPGMVFWGAGTNGPAVPPGRYTARLAIDGRTVTTPLVVTRNPRTPDVSNADLRAQYAFSRRVRDKAEEANQAVIAIRRVKAQLADRLKKSNDAALKTASDSLLAHASAVEESIYQVKNQSNQDPLNFPIKVNNRLATLLSMAENGDGRPTNNMPEIFGIMSTELKGYTDRLSVVWKADLVAVNRELARLKLIGVDPNCDKVAERCG
jgi:hypothetical protein